MSALILVVGMYIFIRIDPLQTKIYTNFKPNLLIFLKVAHPTKICTSHKI
jgi:hypothetical protein